MPAPIWLIPAGVGAAAGIAWLVKRGRRAAGKVQAQAWKGVKNMRSEITSFVKAHSPMPCSHLAGAWVLSRLGKVPSDVSNWKEWRKLDPKLWDAINVWEGDGRGPWTGVIKVASAFGSRPTFVKPGAARPKLTVGRWYYVQRYADPDKVFTNPAKAGGHSYLVQALGDGDFRVVQDSLKYGFRDKNQSKWVDDDKYVGITEVV